MDASPAVTQPEYAHEQQEKRNDLLSASSQCRQNADVSSKPTNAVRLRKTRRALVRGGGSVSARVTD
ncbi:hypothetical protein BaRGS_00018216 [Batillaria attramentaria]|uniref:Uncharacterized protein n=1 Tax=Batillaria attramentaria TaxID=370345 RepID=A0ABD0KTP2_9CAEN